MVQHSSSLPPAKESNSHKITEKGELIRCEKSKDITHDCVINTHVRVARFVQYLFLRLDCSLHESKEIRDQGLSRDMDSLLSLETCYGMLCPWVRVRLPLLGHICLTVETLSTKRREVCRLNGN